MKVWSLICYSPPSLSRLSESDPTTELWCTNSPDEFILLKAGRLKSSEAGFHSRTELPRLRIKIGRTVAKIGLLTAAALMLGSGTELSAQVIQRISSSGKFYVDDKAGI